jgi:c(7)-type cytochrome triheme protein
MARSITLVLSLALASAAVAGPASAQNPAGKALYEKSCAFCHGAGIAGAPKFGDRAAWGSRARAGIATLYKSALTGTPNGMPARGGNLSSPDADVKAAVDYMLGAAGVTPGAAPAAAAAAAAKPAVSPAPAAPPAAKPAAAAPAPAAKPAAAAPAPQPASPQQTSVAAPGTKPAPVAAPPAHAAAEAGAAQGRPQAVVVATADPNAFNRLLTPPAARNRPPAEDGIHDAANPGTLALQPPLTAFGALPKSNAGNRIDWVAALKGKQLQPRWDVANPTAEPVVMDLNIVREVKGSMPDVVYPHKQHTEWLDCANCHPAIFIPQKGANQISMAAIMLGEKCGVCHGKVAFPVSECKLCHSKQKEGTAAAAAAPANHEAKR